MHDNVVDSPSELKFFVNCGEENDNNVIRGAKPYHTFL